MNLKEYLKSNKWLPENLKDFHDQKDVFKTLHDWMTSHPSSIDSSSKMPNWVDGQIYTIDKFLYFMALHGWTLQKSRSHSVEFLDLDVSIEALKTREIEAFKALLNKSANADNPTNTDPA